MAVNRDQIGFTAAGVAFYALLSIFPGMAALISLWGLAADPSQMVHQLILLGRLLPHDTVQLISDQAHQIATADRGAIGVSFVVSLALAFFSASAGMRALMQALNLVYHSPETRGIVQFYATAFAMTVVLSVGVLAALGAIILVPLALNAMGLGSVLEPILDFIRWPILFIGAWAGIAGLYRVAPNREDAAWRWIAPGAGAAVVIWLIASVAFSVYVQNFAHYNETYGSLGAVVALMLWFWVSAFVLLFGAELAAAMERESRPHRPT
ncbi:MAG: YihY/virulence factor BrkB family protein [Caulobacterales bacterium]